MSFLKKRLSLEESAIPLDINDLLHICKEYNSLGSKIQNNIDQILELGFDKVFETNSIDIGSIPFILNFFDEIVKNPYFGDACSQAQNSIYLINAFMYNKDNIVDNGNTVKLLN